jgi:hypothetical protein
MAQNNPFSGDQQTEDHCLDGAPGAVLEVHVVPSGDVIICVAGSPSEATAQNRPSDGDQHTDCHVLALALVFEFHVTPSADVITCVATAPSVATAQKS